jgi:hypothetical protein
MEDILKLAYKNVLATPDGKRVMWDILSTTHLYLPSQGEHTEFLEGERNIGLQVLDRISQAEEDGYLKLQLWRKDNG